MATSRQRAIAALPVFKSLSPMEKSAFLQMKHAVNREALARNMLAYFQANLITTPDDVAPPFTMQEFTDALADSLMELGKERGMTIAVLQTLVIELQDRINNTTI